MEIERSDYKNENTKFIVLLEKLSEKAKVDGTKYKIKIDSEVFDKGDRIIWFKEDKGISPDVLKRKTVKGNLENALLEFNKLNKKGNLLEGMFDQFCDYLIDDCNNNKSDYKVIITCYNIIENIDYVSERFCKWMEGNDILCSADITLKKKM